MINNAPDMYMMQPSTISSVEHTTQLSRFASKLLLFFSIPID